MSGRLGLLIDQEITPGGTKSRKFVTGSKDGKHIETQKHQEAFEAWYSLGKNFMSASRQLGIAHMALRRYHEWFNWEKKAAEREGRINAAIAEKATEDVAEMLTDHYDAAGLLIQRGVEYLNEFGIDNPRDAIRAIEMGVRIQRQVKELPEWITKIKGSTDRELLTSATELLQDLERLRKETSAEADGVQIIDVTPRDISGFEAEGDSGSDLGDRAGTEVERFGS